MVLDTIDELDRERVGVEENMTENLIGTFHEEMINGFPNISDTIQYYFVRLAHKFTIAYAD